MRKLIARLVKENEFDEWDKLVEEHGTVFQSIKWTQIFEPNIRRVGIFNKNDELIGGFIYFEKKIANLKFFRNPFYTPQIGPFFKLRAQKKLGKLEELRSILEAVVNFINEEKPAIVSLALSPSIIDTLPFYWANYKVTVNYTYRLDLTSLDTEEFIRGMDVKRRNDIKKVQKEGVFIERSKNVSIFIPLVQKSFERQKKAYPKEIIEEILKKFPPGQSSFLLIVMQKEIPVAGVYVIYDSTTAFNLITGFDDEIAQRGVMSFALFEAIKEAKKLGLKIFDFEGSVVPSIEKFYRGFGGDLVPYYRVNKAWLPFEAILKFLKRQYF